MNPLLLYAVQKLLGLLGLFVADIIRNFLLVDKEKGGLDVLDEIARVAKHIVAHLATTDLPPEEKFTTALRLVQAEGQRLGKDIGDNLAGIIVKSAWGAVKLELP